jgi:uncharacterized membrane protein YkoI
MKSRNRIIIIGATALALAAAGGTAIAVATSDDDDREKPIPANALQRASDAALAVTGGGKVTETEVGDEESLYEVEVTKPDGTQIDVQLDRAFKVVGQESDGKGEDESGEEG